MSSYSLSSDNAFMACGQHYPFWHTPRENNSFNRHSLFPDPTIQTIVHDETEGGRHCFQFNNHYDGNFWVQLARSLHIRTRSTSLFPLVIWPGHGMGKHWRAVPAAECFVAFYTAHWAPSYNPITSCYCVKSGFQDLLWAQSLQLLRYDSILPFSYG